jgi:hypothetical protein
MEMKNYQELIKYEQFKQKKQIQYFVNSLAEKLLNNLGWSVPIPYRTNDWHVILEKETKEIKKLTFFQSFSSALL